MSNFYGTDGTDVAGGPYDAFYGGGGDDALAPTKNGYHYLEAGTGSDLIYLANTNFKMFGDGYGGDGNDDIFGGDTTDLDRLYGGAGDDWIKGAEETSLVAGPELMFGGPGRDDLDGYLGADTLYGGEGDESGDVIIVGFGFGTFPGLYGGAGDDYCDGGDGNDLLDGGAGADVLIGGFGSDTFLVDGAGDQVFEGAGGGADVVRVVATTVYNPVTDMMEVVSLPTGAFALAAWAEVEVFLVDDPTLTTTIDLVGSTFSNQITGNAGANSLTGLGGDDGLFGLVGNDKLDGGVGNDTLDGGAGNDSLKGGAGKDTLTGGSGKDIFVFDSTPHKTTNVDRITDFRWQDDTLHLDNAYLKKVGSNGKLKADAFHLGRKAADAEDRVIYDKGTGSLYYDADGTGKAAAIKIAILQKNATLKLSDFLVI